MNYASRRVPFKTRALRFIGITAALVSIGLLIVGADQLGQHWQEHRAGFVSH